MLSISRYLATVRRAILMPSLSSRIFTIAWSLWGFDLSSEAMIFLIACLTLSEAMSSSETRWMDELKKYLSSKRPCGVWTYLLEVTRERRDAWLSPSSPGEPSLLVTLVTHGAFYVGATIVRSHGGVWQVRRPLWESTVRLVSPAGTGDLAVFHWWLKALSDDEIDEGRLADRYRTHVEVPTFDAEALPVIAPADRRLPRLVQVRYDLLYKHLRAHLPELRDVGADFPSPERFEEIGFKHLDLALVGGGRMLLLHGPGAEGLHLYWLTTSGFVKGAYFPADAFPVPVVQVDGDKIRVLLRLAEREVVHEMLWWGA